VIKQDDETTYQELSYKPFFRRRIRVDLMYLYIAAHSSREYEFWAKETNQSDGKPPSAKIKKSNKLPPALS